MVCVFHKTEWFIHKWNQISKRRRLLYYFGCDFPLFYIRIEYLLYYIHQCFGRAIRISKIMEKWNHFIGWFLTRIVYICKHSSLTKFYTRICITRVKYYLKFIHTTSTNRGEQSVYICLGPVPVITDQLIVVITDIYEKRNVRCAVNWCSYINQSSAKINTDHKYQIYNNL